MQLPVTKIQKFCTHDGPGIRTTVFLKGCPLRCVWCHNPETQSIRQEWFWAPQLCIGCGACADVCPNAVHTMSPSHQIERSRCEGCMACAAACPAGALEACAQMMEAEDILAEIMKDRVFYGERGGVTFSGGEPLVHSRALLPILQAVKREGLTTAIETCGVFDTADLAQLVHLTDLFLWDVKDTDPARHLANTGGRLETVLEHLRQADVLGAKTRLRCILLQGVNLNEAHLSSLAELFGTLHHCEGIELLPYHVFGDSKNLQLGRASAAHPEWIPSQAQMDDARAFIRRHAVLVTG